MPRKLRDNAHHTSPHSSCLILWQAPVCHVECNGTYCALSVAPSGRASFDFTGGTGSDRSQMIWDESKPSWLIPLEQLTESGEHGCRLHSPPSVVLEGPLQRAGLGPVPCPVRPSRPRASSEVVRPTSPWHDASPASGIRAENSPPIHHSCLPAVLLLHRHFS